MRSFIARLSVTAIAGLALAGCSGSGPIASGGIGGSGSGGSVPGSPGVGALASCSKPPVILDAGNASYVPPAGTWVGFNNVVTDLQATGNPTGNDTTVGPTVGWTTVPSCAPPQPPYDGIPGDIGYEQLVISGGTTTSAIMKLTNVPVPNLTYSYGGYNFNYTAIVMHIGWPTVSSLGQPSSIGVELAGSGATATFTGASASTYDVRSACTVYPAGFLQPAPLWSILVCPITVAYGTVKNTAGPNPVAPGAAGAFTPIDPTVFVVFNYGKATNPSQQAIANFTYMYAYQ